MQENETCGRNVTFSYYVIDIAKIEHNIGIVNASENARSTTLVSDDLDPSCTTILDWMICFLNLHHVWELAIRLLKLCGNGCGEVIHFFEVCFDATDPTVREHFNGFSTYSDKCCIGEYQSDFRPRC